MAKQKWVVFLLLLTVLSSSCDSSQKFFDTDSIDDFTYKFYPGYTSADEGFVASIKFDLKNATLSGNISNFSNTVSCSISHALLSSEIEMLRTALSKITYSQVSNSSVLADASESLLQLNDDEAEYYYDDIAYAMTTLVMNSNSFCSLNSLMNEIIASTGDTSDCGEGINTLPEECILK